MNNKDLQNVIREVSKIVPSRHFVSTGFLLDLLNSPYNEIWFLNKSKIMGMLTNYFNYTLAGSSNDEFRGYAKATHKLANMLTHRRNATKRDMLLTVSSTIALVNLIMVFENVY